jgi:hypothetical protein
VRKALRPLASIAWQNRESANGVVSEKIPYRPQLGKDEHHGAVLKPSGMLRLRQELEQSVIDSRRRRRR